MGKLEGHIGGQLPANQGFGPFESDIEHAHMHAAAGHAVVFVPVFGHGGFVAFAHHLLWVRSERLTQVAYEGALSNFYKLFDGNLELNEVRELGLWNELQSGGELDGIGVGLQLDHDHHAAAGEAGVLLRERRPGSQIFACAAQFGQRAAHAGIR